MAYLGIAYKKDNIWIVKFYGQNKQTYTLGELKNNEDIKYITNYLNKKFNNKEISRQQMNIIRKTIKRIKNKEMIEEENIANIIGNKE